MDDAVRELAREAGIAIDWIDAADRPQRVSVESLRSILAALGFPCASKADIADSRARLRRTTAAPTFLTATAEAPVRLTGIEFDRDLRGRIDARSWRDEQRYAARRGWSRRARANRSARLSPTALRGARHHARDCTAALRDTGRHRAGRKTVWPCRTALRIAARGRWRIRRHHRAVRSRGERRPRRRGRDCTQPDARSVRGRSFALCAILAVEPPVSQPALCRSGTDLRQGPPGDDRGGRRKLREAGRADRLAERHTPEVCAAAPALRRRRDTRVRRPRESAHVRLSLIRARQRRSPA